MTGEEAIGIFRGLTKGCPLMLITLTKRCGHVKNSLLSPNLGENKSILRHKFRNSIF